MSGELERAADRFVADLDALDRERILAWLGEDVQAVDEVSRTWLRGTDALRDSPAPVVAALLRQAGAELTAYDPGVPAGGLGSDAPAVAVVESPYVAAKDVDAIVIVTDWPEFRSLDWPRLAELTPLRIECTQLFQKEGDPVLQIRPLRIAGTTVTGGSSPGEDERQPRGSQRRQPRLDSGQPRKNQPQRAQELADADELDELAGQA